MFPLDRLLAVPTTTLVRFVSFYRNLVTQTLHLRRSCLWRRPHSRISIEFRIRNVVWQRVTAVTRIC